MLEKKFKQFGVWMDTQHATIIGVSHDNEADGFKVLAHVKATGNLPNSNEHTFNNDRERNETAFFKDIAAHLQNAEEVYVTGHGTSQETFSHFLQETPQFKNVKTTLDTAQQMSDEALVEKVRAQYHG